MSYSMISMTGDSAAGATTPSFLSLESQSSASSSPLTIDFGSSSTSAFSSPLEGGSGEENSNSSDGWPHPDDYIKTFRQLKPQPTSTLAQQQYQFPGFELDRIGTNENWLPYSNSPTVDSLANSGTASVISSPPNEDSNDSYSADASSFPFGTSFSLPPTGLPSEPRTTNHVNYYPNFDPKEYFCDTVAVENASMVAQIVGKKGAKIKHLVAKYGIRIRTPNMDQEPVFVIRGKRSDVYSVKQEIQSAANHFMRIESMKQVKLNDVMSNQNATTFKVYVPNQYIGLVIGRNGRVVRDIQSQHNVHIETPKFDVRQYFIVYGSQAAIEATLKVIHDLLVKKSGIRFTMIQRQADEVHFAE